MADAITDTPPMAFDEAVSEFEAKANRTANFMDRAVIGFSLDPTFYMACLACVIVPLMLLSMYLTVQIYKEQARDKKKNRGKRKARKAAMEQAANNKDD